ncbi:MAG: alpha/beta hydrolase family protein [Chloroflexota bacterium]
MTDFHLQNHLDFLRMVPGLPQNAPPADPDAFRSWQTALHTELQRLMGLDGRSVPPVSARRLGSLDCGDYVEEKYALDAGEGVQIPVYMLTPKGRKPPATVLVFHGHEPSVQYALGRYPDEATGRHNLSIGNNYAQALARAGYRVAAVEQRGFGERVSDDLRGPFPRSCRHLSLSYVLHGRTLLGERCWDGQRVIDYLLTQPDVDADRIAVTGHSGGGATALWLAAIEPRLCAAAVSGYFSSFRSSIAREAHCECNYVPGILAVAEMSDLAMLIAPRAFCALNGEKDHLFPVQAARESFEIVQQAYARLGVSQSCHLAVHPGGHEYPQALSLQWLEKTMAQRGAGGG